MTIFGYDTETTGLEPYHGDSMFMFSTSDYKGKEYKPFRIDGRETRRIQNTKILEELWTNPNKGITSHNLKFDLTFTENYLGKRFVGETHCTLLMAWLLMNLHPHHELKGLCWELGKISTDDQENIKGYGGFNFVPEDKMNRYAAIDAFRHMFLFRVFYPEIQSDEGMLEAYKVEIGCVRPVMEMEKRGLRLDANATKKLIYNVSRDVHRIENEIYLRAGRRFNIDSPEQLADVLYNKMGLPILGYTKKDKKPATGKAILWELRNYNKIADRIMKYRSYRKTIPTLEKYLYYSDSDYIIHSDMQITGTKTGRMASKRPNLQNVQREGTLRNPHAIPARSLFIAREGFTNYHFDYKGQELRLLVHYHKDPEYKRIILSGGDPHQATGEPFYGKKASIKKYRDAAKNGTFTIGYGGGVKKLAQTLALSIEKTKIGLENYRERFPNAANFAREMALEVTQKGFVRTTFGRKIQINPQAIYTSAGNARIQGTGADIMKRAIIKVDRLMNEVGRDCHLILPIHDELIVGIPDSIKPRKRMDILRAIKKEMEDFDLFEIPMEVECKRSKVWNKKTEVVL